MAERPIPGSLKWLGVLIALAIAAALLGGALLYLQARHATRTAAGALTGGNVDRGHDAIGRYGCGGCHEIPGVAGANGAVGPSLKRVATRAHLAGSLANDPGTLIRWLRHPQALRPGSGMPEQGVTPQDARDMAAYLYTAK